MTPTPAPLAASAAPDPTVELARVRAELETANAALRERRSADAQAAINRTVCRGALKAKDEVALTRWRKLCEDDPANITLLDAMEGNALLAADAQATTKAATRAASASLDTRHSTLSLQAREGPARIIGAYAKLLGQQIKLGRDVSVIGFARRGELSRQMSQLFASEMTTRDQRTGILELRPEFASLPLSAADYSSTDPEAASLGILSGTLVAQRTLQLFKLEFPLFTRIFTDFSDTPAQFKQTEATRIIIVPAVQAYDPTLDAVFGRPKGWCNVAPAQTKDVLLTLDEHVGVPIIFDANTLASTMRRLFDEQAPAAAYALARYFVQKVYALFTAANYNAYAVVNGAKVPVAYRTYSVAIGDFARSTLTKIAAVLNPNEVPIGDRVVLLTSPYFEQLATDPSLVTFFAGQQAPEIVTANRLPKLANFEPIEAPNLTQLNTGVAQPNLVGMVLHKAGVVAKTRLSNDYTVALPGSSYGSVTTITDPDIGISVVLVQYVNHDGGYAEWRIQVMLGAAVGDPRGGLCITSQ
jgi:hypothetical protein